MNELLDHIKFDHGYTASSPPVVNVSRIFSFLNILNFIKLLMLYTFQSGAFVY